MCRFAGGCGRSEVTPPPYVHYALQREQAGDYSRARHWISLAVVHDSNNARLWLLRARIETEVGDIDAALRSLMQVRRLNPHYAMLAAVSALRERLLNLATSAASGSVGVALAFDSASPLDERVIRSSFLGPAQKGLDARMQRAADHGPYSITCTPVIGSSLNCTPMKDEDVIPALRRGETVYGRTVIGFPGGAGAQETAPMLEATDLVCAGGSGESLSCSPVTGSKVGITGGADTFVFYKQHHVTFGKDGNPVGHLGAATVSLQVIPSS